MKFVTLVPSENQASSLASNVTPSTGPHFKKLGKAIKSVYKFKQGPPAIVPTLMSGD